LVKLGWGWKEEKRMDRKGKKGRRGRKREREREREDQRGRKKLKRACGHCYAEPMNIGRINKQA
jgi:hypothetical protein